MRARVGARDREAEAGAGDPVARDAGAGEAVEERLLDLTRDARARVLDGDTEDARSPPSRSRVTGARRTATRS